MCWEDKNVFHMNLRESLTLNTNRYEAVFLRDVIKRTKFKFQI